MAVTMKAWIIWFFLLLGIASAWPFEKLPIVPVAVSENGLSVRDDTPEFSPSTGCQAVCKSSGCPGCNSKRSLSWPLGSLDISSGDNVTDIDHSWKRMLAPTNAQNVDGHVLGLANGDNVKSIVSQNSQRYISFSVQEKFADHPDTNKPLIVGVDGGFLTGCTVLTVVSSRAVYMAHFYQDLGFFNDDPEEGDPKVDFQGTVLNLISGTLSGTPEEVNADGPGIDPSLFTADGDMPYASLMVPRHNNQGKSAYFPKMNKQIMALVQRLIPGCRIDQYKYFAEGSYPRGSARGAAVLEYDADADGQGNGDWRLWYETKDTRGRVLGQDVIPRA